MVVVVVVVLVLVLVMLVLMLLLCSTDYVEVNPRIDLLCPRQQIKRAV